MTLCFVGWGGFFFWLHERGVNHIDHFVWTTIYFLSAGLLIAALFWSYTASALQGFTATPLIVLGVFMAAQYVLYAYFPKYVAEPTTYLQKYPNRDYLKIDRRRLLSKSMDITAQQVFIVLLVFFLKDAGLSLVGILGAFTILFGLLHVPLIASEKGRWPSWLFGGIVIVFSVIFPVLILDVRYGFVYNIMLHWTFYTLTAVIFWIVAAKRKTALQSRAGGHS